MHSEVAAMNSLTNQEIINRIKLTCRNRDWEDAVIARDSNTCKHCKHKDTYLTAYRVKSLETIIDKNNIKTEAQALSCDEIFDLDNSITLCIPCCRMYNDDNHRRITWQEESEEYQHQEGQLEK